MWGLRAEKVTHNMLRTTRASSDIRLGSQGGSQTTLTSTFPTPGTVETAFCTITGSSCADGQGRLYLYALAAAGQAGVERALENLRAEIERDMKLMGCRSVDQLSRDNLRFR
jgi:hypothetical protein